jgi:hypothetical protein
MVCGINTTYSQVNYSPSYVIHNTGTIPFNDTVKTYIYFLNDSSLLVEETIILYENGDGKQRPNEYKEYAPWYYYMINRKTQTQKIFKVDFDGNVSFKGNQPTNQSSLQNNFLYGGEEPAFTPNNFLNKSSRVDSSGITIISTIPEKYPEFILKYFFKKRENSDKDRPSLSPLADLYLNENKYCYMTETISIKDPNYFGRTEILPSGFAYPKQKPFLQNLLKNLE